MHVGEHGCLGDGGQTPYPVGAGLLAAAHALQHGAVQTQLQAGLVQHLPLVRVPGDQAVHLDRLGLPDTVASRLGLEEGDRWRERDRDVETQWRSNSAAAAACEGTGHFRVSFYLNRLSCLLKHSAKS